MDLREHDFSTLPTARPVVVRWPVWAVAGVVFVIALALVGIGFALGLGIDLLPLDPRP